MFAGETNVGIQVLETAINVVKGLSPLSFANEQQLSPTGIDGLTEMTDYLREICVSSNGACTQRKFFH